MWRLSGADQDELILKTKPVSLKEVHLEDLVFSDEELVIVLMLFRGTNPTKCSADYLPKHILEAFARVKTFKRESLSCLMASSLSV